jgi:RNA polymerase sigma-B factor
MSSTLPLSSRPPVAANIARAQADRALFERLADKRDPVDREVLVERFLPLARSLAARYQRRGHPFEDLFQVACLGLVKAIDRYDVSRGRAFSSFAVPTIAGEIKRYYRDRTWTVHVARDLKELTLLVDRTRVEVETELGRSPTPREIAERLGVDEEAVLEALQATHAQCATSLDAPAGDDDGAPTTIGELIGVRELGFDRAEERADLRALARALTPRERLAVGLRFERDMTQREIGDILGVSQMQVSRILRAAVARLREHARQRERVSERERERDCVAA